MLHYTLYLQGILLIQNAERIKKNLDNSALEELYIQSESRTRNRFTLAPEPHFTLRLSKIDCKESL